jgi:predicted ATPase
MPRKLPRSSFKKAAKSGQMSFLPEPPPKSVTFIKALRLDMPGDERSTIYPFSIPAIRSLERMEFKSPVTFFVGENGSGKSTLLEAMAVKLRFNPEGGSRDLLFETSATHSELCDFLTLERQGHFKDGFFLRAESFYNVASALEGVGSSFSAYGGKPLHHQSHGESFLSLLNNRLRGQGVYLFDEPEAALSPQRQLSVLTLLHRLVRHQSQLIIATHSPILLAYPEATIYEFSGEGIRQIAYEDTEHFRITRDFLNRHQRMVEILISEEEEDLRSKAR